MSRWAEDNPDNDYDPMRIMEDELFKEQAEKEEASRNKRPKNIRISRNRLNKRVLQDMADRKEMKEFERERNDWTNMKKEDWEE